MCDLKIPPVDDMAAAIIAIKAELMRVGFDVSGPLTNTVLAVKDICDAFLEGTRREH